MYMCKKIAHIKNISHGKSSYFLIIIQRFCPFSVELLSISTKICIQKVSILRKKIMFQQLIVNFADFQQNNHVFMQKNCVFKNHNLWGKIYVSTKQWQKVGILILLIFNKMIRSLQKRTVHLKYISLKKSSYFENDSRILLIIGKVIIYL